MVKIYSDGRLVDEMFINRPIAEIKVYLRKNVKFDYKNANFGGKGKIKIGDNTVIINSFSMAAPAVIGKNCWIGKGCFIDKYVKIGNNVNLLGQNHVANSTKIRSHTLLELWVFTAEQSIIGDHTLLEGSIKDKYTEIGAGKKTFDRGGLCYYYNEYEEKIIYYNVKNAASMIDKIGADMIKKDLIQIYKNNDKVVKIIKCTNI